MNKDDKAWLLAVAYATTQPKEITPEEFLSEVERSEVDFLSLLTKREEEESAQAIKTWEQLGSSN
ncbi:TPA: hypothetical protein ACGBUC_004082 [Klebsiella variicola]|uniref:hypothetical protein n=1 Tax=Klebsiella pneumoniae complex TaxID=3390273 RepID=UPI000447AB9D|nr:MULTISPECIES: hypothetical protein [Klebsiella]HCI6064292.1 hypothetical protein [Klebsiella variicola subsp. variicola]EKU3005054.1 hypothetical protein [Klebsiella pneumoniae]EWD82902.1 hypothetical protein P821_00725 [Klebsiella variicola]MCH6140078.1 hypothetical protein [Klebsiella variicola]MCH6175204.1 hypothetical protein [Klebsiella variicola]